MTTSARTLAAFVLVVAALIGLGALLTSDYSSPVEPVSVSQAAVVSPAVTVLDPVLSAAFGDADFTEAQTQEVWLAADRICEGYTAGVPLMVMADQLVAEQGITDEQAHDFVRLVVQTRCTGL